MVAVLRDGLIIITIVTNIITTTTLCHVHSPRPTSSSADTDFYTTHCVWATSIISRTYGDRR